MEEDLQIKEVLPNTVECVRCVGFESCAVLAKLCENVRGNVRFVSRVSRNGTCMLVHVLGLASQ